MLGGIEGGGRRMGQLTSSSFTSVQQIKVTVAAGDKPGVVTGIVDGTGLWREKE